MSRGCFHLKLLLGLAFVMGLCCKPLLDAIADGLQRGAAAHAQCAEDASGAVCAGDTRSWAAPSPHGCCAEDAPCLTSAASPIILV